MHFQPTQPAGTGRRFSLASVPLFDIIATGGALVSAALGVVGVLGVYGFGSPLAVVGSAIVIACTILTELGASYLPREAQLRAREGKGGVVKAVFVVAIYFALSTWNVFAGHMGATTIDRTAVCDRRCPLERTYNAAVAAQATAEAEVAAFDAETTRRAQARQEVIMGADGRYVTARGNQMAIADQAADAREAARTAVQAKLDAAVLATANAHTALDAVPAEGRPDYERWCIAAVLLLISGAMRWAGTPAAAKRAEPANVLSISPGDYAAMTAEQLTEIVKRASVARALAQHARARLLKGAA